MTPLTQTIMDTGDPARQGNCLQAAVASILNLAIEDVPHFVQQDVDSEGQLDWLELLCDWLVERGKVLRLGLDWRPMPGEDYLVFGRTVRGTAHVVIYRDGALLHDPHPSRAGVLGGWENPYVIRPAPDAVPSGEATDDAPTKEA